MVVAPGAVRYDLTFPAKHMLQLFVTALRKARTNSTMPCCESRPSTILHPCHSHHFHSPNPPAQPLSAIPFREELIKLGLANMLVKLEEAAGHDKNLLRYIQRAQLKLGPTSHNNAPGGPPTTSAAHH